MIGYRKMIGFGVLIVIFVGFSLLLLFMMKEFDIEKYVSVFIPLGTALSIIAGPFFTANVMAKWHQKRRYSEDEVGD